MDGWDDKSYVEYRNVKDGEYTKIINNIKNFKKLKGHCLLGVSLIIDEKKLPTYLQYDQDHEGSWS